MEIYMIRHGETQWNKERKFQGQVDIPLNEYGIQLAEETAKALRDIPFTRIYSSPLSRAYDTARILTDQRPLEIIVDDRLIEMAFGEAEGTSIETILQHPELAVYNFIYNPQDYLPPSGGESFDQLYDRCADFLKNVVIPLEKECDHMMIVAHGALIRGLIHHIHSRPTRDFWLKPHKNCCVTIASCINGQLTLKEEAIIYYPKNAQSHDCCVPPQLQT